jgi:tetratricopeptide (TPR) repeat protein
MVVFSMGRAEVAKRTQTSLRDAVRFFTRAIATDPQYADAHAELAKTYALIFSYGDETPEHLVKAEEAASRAVELDPSTAEGWAAFGLIHMQRHDKDAATAALEKALSLNPNHAMANMWLGELQVDPKQRQAYHERAFALDPRSPVAGYNVANDLFESGHDAEAMDVFSQIVKADPYYPKAYELVGRINERHGRIAAAIRHYEQAINLDPRADTSVKLAYLYMDIGDFDTADQWIDKAFTGKTESPSSELQWLRISALAARGDQAAARAHMREMLDVSAADFAAYSNATIAAYFLAEPQLAIDAWERRQQLQAEASRSNDMRQADPGWIYRDNLEAPIAAAYAYAHLGRQTDSETVLTELESWLDGQIGARVRVSPDLWYVKAQVMSIRGESNLALLHLQRAIDEGWRQHWRPFIEPCLADLLELETFNSMMAGLAARMQLMGEQLEFDGLFASVAPQSI